MRELTHKQDKAISALLSEPTIGAAAAKIGIGESTLHTWLADSDFSEAYRAARREATQQAIARLQQQSSAAAGVLVDLMNDTSKPGSIA